MACICSLAWGKHVSNTLNTASTVKSPGLHWAPYSQVSFSDVRQQHEGIHKLLTQKINPAQPRTDERIAHSLDKCVKS